ncbi:hypothetical protein [Paracoccus sp. (in: a-proteobacteria)]|uniref:hypothetical protein n=1 Tax=Paracoccus sp. TaxID=267 RepID=UPI00396CE86A
MSVLVSILAMLALIMMDFSILSAFLYGYVGGGFSAMIILSIATAAFSRAAECYDNLASGAAYHNLEGPHDR